MAPGMGSAVQRESGIIVPAELEREPDATKGGDVPGAYDLDGRRRLVLTREDQRAIDRLLKTLIPQGLGVLVICGNRRDGKPPCGRPLKNEGRGTADAGYGCDCTRIHFIGAEARGLKR